MLLLIQGVKLTRAQVLLVFRWW